MLFETDRHEPLIQDPWDEQVALDTIQEIARDARASFSEAEFWPIHPFDVSPERARTLKPIYYGAAGVIWSLDYLGSVGAIPQGYDYAPHMAALLDAHRADSLQLAGRPLLGFPIGDAGILLLNYKLAPSDAIADELFQVIDANADHPARGFVWGGAGSALAAVFMFELSGEDRWRRLFLSMVERLWNHWEYDHGLGCYLWWTDLYGAKEKRTMALHGLPGIVFPMLRGREHLPPERAAVLIDRVYSMIEKTAVREGEFANWPLSVSKPSGPEALVPRLQHCIGAPGILNSFATHLPPSDCVEDLLSAGGELVWRAGPLVKMPSLCHGVPGSGFAFLKLFERTRDTKWLERARCFAMHAIFQNRRFTEEYGVRKFSLWTGDLGLAIYLWRCIEATASFPTLDEF
jgi:hypothetical protein